MVYGNNNHLPCELLEGKRSRNACTGNYAVDCQPKVVKQGINSHIVYSVNCPFKAATDKFIRLFLKNN